MARSLTNSAVFQAPAQLRPAGSFYSSDIGFAELNICTENEDLSDQADWASCRQQQGDSEVGCAVADVLIISSLPREVGLPFQRKPRTAPWNGPMLRQRGV